MKLFGKLGIELKAGILFSVSALVFSIIAGLAGSVPAGVVVLRAIVVTPVFFVVGYGVLLVLEKFVPEIYTVISDLNAKAAESAEKIDISTDTSEDNSEEYSEKADSGFTEFTEKDYDRLQTVKDPGKAQSSADTGLDEMLHTSGTKLGKHIIVEDQLNSYEPKLMAQAIRTMMGKDKD